MKKRFGILSTTLLISAVLLSACGSSDEKRLEAETAKGLMIEAKESAEEVYLDITDSSQEEKLNELDSKVKEIEAIDLKKYSDTKIDETITTINEITEEYQNLQKDFESVLKKETKEKTEAEKHMDVRCYFINRTGMNLSKVVLHDITEDSYSDNLLGENISLNSGYILMGVVLNVTRSSSEFEFVVTDENNTSYTLTCDDLTSLKIDEVSITLKYDTETKTGSAIFFVNNSSGESVEESSSSSSGASSEASKSSSEG